MLRQLLFTAAFGCLTGLAAQAQANFQPGYVVLPAGDTLRGEVDFRESPRSARLCRYRAASSAAVVEYTPEQLRGYGFPRKRSYATYSVQLVPDALGNELTQTQFLEVLVRGELLLLYRPGDDGREVYYLAKASNDATITELLHRRTPDVQNGSTANREDNRFRGALSEAFANCPAERMRVGTLVYTRGALTAAVQRYNECVNPTATLPTNTGLRRSQFTWGVVAGIEKSHYSFGEEDRPIKGDLGSRVGPAVGLGLDWHFANMSEQLTFRLEALYERQEYNGPLENQTRLNYTGAQAFIKSSYLRLPLMLRYTLPSSRVQPFVQAGINYSRVLQLEQYFQFRYQTNGQEGLAPARPITDDERHYELGPVLALGAQLPGLAGRTFQVEARAEAGGGFVTYDSFSNYVLRYYLLLGHSLTK